jgi:hypothetical protein
MPTPVRELRRVQVIPAQEGAQLAGLLARVGLREDAEPILCGDRRRCAFAGISGSGSVARDVVHFHGCRPKTPAGRHARRTSGTRPLPPPASGGPRCEATSTCVSPQTYARDGSWNLVRASAPAIAARHRAARPDLDRQPHDRWWEKPRRPPSPGSRQAVCAGLPCSAWSPKV